MRALLIEDAQGMGFADVIEARDGAEGWKRLTQHEVDMVLTDWDMPRGGNI